MLSSLYPIKLYLKHKPNLVLLGIALLLNIAIWGWLGWYIRPQEEPLFLHYNVLFGVDLTGEWYRVFAVPVMGLVLFFINALIGLVLFQRDKFIAYLLNATTVMCHILLLVEAALLVFLNV